VIERAESRPTKAFFGRDLAVVHSSEDLSPADKQIVRMLQDDGRMAYSQIARAIGMTERAVASRVSTLLRDNVIEITVVAHPWALGYGFGALIGVSSEVQRSGQDLVFELVGVPDVTHAAATTGRYQFMIECFVTEIGRVEEVVRNASQLLGDRARFEIHPYVGVEYQHLDYDAAFAKGGGTPGAAEVRAPAATPSDTDREILKRLSVDGRRSFRSIAADLGVSEGQVRQRLGRLVADNTVRIQAIVNPYTLGFRAVGWLGIVLSPQADSREVAAALEGIRGISYVTLCLGRFGIFAELIAVDMRGLHDVLENSVRPLPGIERVEPFVYLAAYYKRIPPASD
jgi:DNA-binding Lrp family transcriptional regulator